MHKFLIPFNEILTFYFIFPAAVLLGLYLAFRLRFIQVLKLGKSGKYLLGSRQSDTGISHYQAVAGVLAGNFGTGNISGMAIAVASGGAGALVWMWLIAFLGAGIQYASCVLGVKHRERNTKGEYVGGPMYYLPKKLGAVFAVFALIGALTVGNFTQVNSMVLPLSDLGISPYISGLAIALLVGLVLIGGIQRFAKTAAAVVPIMALFYFLAAAIILALHFTEIPGAFKQMFMAAFSPKALFGGAMGYSIIKVVTTGFDRGIFATDAGTGIAPILQSSTDSENPVASGLVTLVTPLLVMIVCTMTGLVLLVTGAAQSGAASTSMVTLAFSKGLKSGIGGHIVILSLFLFSYTTILAWATCAERAIGFLFDDRWIKRFRLFFILMIPIGALVEVNLVWLLADLSITFMVGINMLGIARLSHEVVADSKQYFQRT